VTEYVNFQIRVDGAQEVAAVAAVGPREVQNDLYNNLLKKTKLNLEFCA